jgi:hypothetical protein
MSNTVQKRIDGPKIAKISTQTKLKWVKFDTKFTGFLDNHAKIHQLIKDSFEAAGLSKEYDELNKEQDVNELIREHLQNTQQNKLSQKNVQAIVKDMYQYFDEEDEVQQSTIAAPKPARDYQDYYMRIKAVATDKNWNDQ